MTGPAVPAELGADAADPRIRAACAYVLEHSQAATGGFAASGNISSAPPPESRVIHCLNGNLLRALLGFGWLRVDGKKFAGYLAPGDRTSIHVPGATVKSVRGSEAGG